MTTSHHESELNNRRICKEKEGPNIIIDEKKNPVITEPTYANKDDFFNIASEYMGRR